MLSTFGNKDWLHCQNRGNMSCMRRKWFGSATHRSVDLFGIQLMDWLERNG